MRKRFDFNRDGKVNFWDHFLAYGAHEAAMDAVRREKNANIGEEEYSWREEYEWDAEYGVDPEDYETEDEYLEALNEEKYVWRETCEDGLDYAVFPEDFETEEEYLEALEDAKCD